MFVAGECHTLPQAAVHGTAMTLLEMVPLSPGDRLGSIRMLSPTGKCESAYRAISVLIMV